MAPSKSNASDEAGFKRLVELETEYRTQRSPDQLYAIASFPHLFDEFPYPVIINAGILKLADYFRQSNNIQRHAILQVFKKSQPHLKKVINVEETIKRISPMLQSNDPLARAITLRVLGGMATIVSDRIDVYHNVIHSLDSSEAMEVSAAVYAADMICAQSQRFCAIISGKLAFMVRDTLKTPLPLRRRLIRIFGHMFEDITLARLARKTCMDILELNQDAEYTVAILRTLTKLASHSLVDVNQQIDLLIQRAKASSNSEPGIRRVSLTCLGSLAQKNIEFSRDQIQAIFDIALESEDEKTTLKAMITLCKIFRLTSAMTSISLLDMGTEIIKIYIQVSIQILERSFSKLATNSNSSSSVASLGSKLVVLECYSVLAVMLPYYRQLGGAGLVSVEDSTFSEAVGKVTQSMEQFLLMILSRRRRLSKEDAAQSKMVLSSLVTLTLEGGSGIGELLTTLLEWINTYKESSTMLAKALLHIARLHPRKLQGFQDTIITCLENYVEASDTQTFTLVYRALLEFSALHRSPGSAVVVSFESRVIALLEKFGRVDMLERYTRNHWDLYQIARYSLQTGWSSLALVALRNQEKTVNSVSASLWLSTVNTVAQIESSLQTITGGQADSGQLNLCSQKQLYTKVISHLEELEAHQVDRSFHLQFSELRRQYLDTCQSLVGILQLLSTSININRRQHQHQLQREWHIADEIALYRCADKFNNLAHQYTLLRAVVSSTPALSRSGSLLVKADQHSDGAIEILQTMCLIIAYTIQRVAKILDHAGNNDKTNNSSDAEPDIMDADVFDVDPLLIPLLYLQSQYQERQGRMQVEGDVFEGTKTVLDVFKISTGLTLGYIDENVKGNDIEAIEKGISILRQLILRYISYSIPIPQEFFVSMKAYAQEQPSIG